MELVNTHLSTSALIQTWLSFENDKSKTVLHLWHHELGTQKLKDFKEVEEVLTSDFPDFPTIYGLSTCLFFSVDLHSVSLLTERRENSPFVKREQTMERLCPQSDLH